MLQGKFLWRKAAQTGLQHMIVYLKLMAKQLSVL